MTGLIRQFKTLLLLAALLAGGSACSTIQSYDDQFQSVYSEYRSGDFEKAAEKATERRFQRRLDSRDGLLWAMEAGKLHHAANDFAESNRYFEQAEAMIRDFEERAVLSLRAGAARASAVVTNPNAIPYQGTYTDKIMINTYKALNYLALGDLEAARVEVRRAHERQQEALAENERAVAEARSEGQAYRSVTNDPALKEAAPIDPSVAQAYANFSNPFTTLVSGIVALADNDPARAEVDFALLASLPIPNPFVREQWEEIRAFLNGENPAALRGPRVFVIFENGLGPAREEMRLDLILPNIGYTGFAFPKLAFQPAQVGGLRISSADAPRITTGQIASMDQIVATEFQARMPAMVLETVSAVVAKEILAKQLTDEMDVIGLLIGSLYKAVVNRADLRSWKTLGKEFQFATVDYPENGILRLSLLGRNKNELPTVREVALPEGEFVLVLARSVHQHDLRIATQALR